MPETRPEEQDARDVARARGDITQAEFWNGAGGSSWVIGQEQLDDQLAPFGALAIEAAAVAAGERVLDIGCGCGATTLELARRVGTDGRVVGLDISAPMVARARERTTTANVELVVADAATATFADPFDLLFSRFGVMFFDEPPKAFAHLRSLLRPSGRLAWVVWQPAAVNPWITVPADAVAELTGPLPFDLAGPGPFSLADADVLHGLLGGAGFVDVAVTGHHVRARIGGGVHGHEAGEFLLDHGPLRRVLGGADPATRADALARIRAAIAPFDGDDGVRLDAAAWVVTARAGAAS